MLLSITPVAILPYIVNGMQGEVELEESPDLFQGPSLPLNPPKSSIGLRKSINWAHPLATSMQTRWVKRSSSRLRCKTSFAQPEKKLNETVQSSEDERPIRLITCPGTGRRGRPRGRPVKHKVSVTASPSEPQEEPKLSCSNQEASHSQTHNRARLTKGGASDELDDDLDMIQTKKAWISVPLDCMDGVVTDHAYKAQDCLHSEANDTSDLRSPGDEPTTKTSDHAEVDHRDVVCSFNTAWQDNCGVSKKTSDVEEDLAEYRKLCESLAGSRRAVHEKERRIHKLLSDQLKVLRKENARIAETAALEQERLRHEISELSQTNSRILKEKIAVERERDIQHNNFLQSVETTRESLRLEMASKHNGIVAELTKELGRERDKSVCQICFCKPRDSIILPCTHFAYCSMCLREVKGSCPTCRGKINGVLRCDLSMS